MGETAYSKKNLRIHTSNESMRNAMYGLVISLVPANVFGAATVVEFFKGNVNYGLICLAAAAVSGLFAVRFGRRYKKQRDGLTRFLDRNPSIYKKNPT